MAEESSGISPASPSAGPVGPVLVPQAALLGKPDIAISRPVITVGSRPSCRLHLVSRSVSQFHALFINSSGSVSVCDLASRVGVQVNGKLVKFAELKSGDRVQIGKFLFRFRAPRPEAVAAPPDPARLEVAGDLPFPLDGRMLLIGRRETCDLPLTDDVEVSTVHAILFQLDGVWIIRDFESRTGTRLNGQKIHQAKLSFGDSISIGKSTFVFSPTAGELDPAPELLEDIAAPAAIESETTAPVSDSEPVAPTEELIAEPEEVFPLEPLSLDPPMGLEREAAEPPPAVPKIVEEPLPAALQAVELPAIEAETSIPPIEIPAASEPSTPLQPTAEAPLDRPAIGEETPIPLTDEVPAESEPLTQEPAAEPSEPPAEAIDAPADSPAAEAPLELADDSAAIETVDFGEVPAPPVAEPEKPSRKRGTRRQPADGDRAPASKPRRSGRTKSVPPVAMDIVDTLAAEATPEPPVVASADATMLPGVAAAVEIGETLAPPESIDPQDMLAVLPVEQPADAGALTMTESLPASAPGGTPEPAVVALADTEACEPIDTRDLAEPAQADVVMTQSEELLTNQWIADNDSSPVEPAEPDSPEGGEPAHLHAVTDAAYTELTALADDEEFVAIPEPEPAEMQITEPAPWPPDEALDAPVADPAAVEPEESEPVADAQPEVSPAGDSEMLGDEVGFNDLTPSTGPPLFGFDFGAGSFLGGMPLTLTEPAGRPDAVARPPEPAPQPPPASKPSPPTAPAAMVDLDESSLLEVSEPAPRQRSGVSPFATATDEPLTSSVRAPINTLADEVAIPPMVSRPDAGAATERPTLTTAFDGLASGLGASGSTLNVDVFSQMAPPILDELFGSRRGDPAEVVLPDKQPEIPPAAARRDPPPLQIPPTDRAPPVRPARPPTPGADAARDTSATAAAGNGYTPPPPDRFTRLPTLLPLMVLSLVAAGMAIYFFLPPPVEVRGTLVFENLSRQPVRVQRQFYVNQVQRLESDSVRNIAGTILSQKSIGPGFIKDDDLEFARVVVNAEWNDDVMTLHHTATDEYAGRARIGALLEALARKDADLNDAVARARRAAADARDAVAAQQQQIARIRADRETQVRIGDAAPRLEDVAVLERKANQLDAAWVAAKTLRSDAQLVLDKLRQSDAKTAADPQDDPVLGELRAHLQQAEAKLASARATTEPSTDTDASAAAGDVTETRAAIDRRLALLQAEQAETPAQRTASRQAAIETQSIRLATLQSAEADAAAAAQAAAVNARDQRTLLENGRMASVHVEELIRRQELAEHKLRELSDDQSAKDDAVNQCVRVAEPPQVDARPGRDIRPAAAALGGAAILIFFGIVAVVSSRPPVPLVSLAPAAAIPAAPVPVFGNNRKPPRPNPTRPRDPLPAKPDQVSAGD